MNEEEGDDEEDEEEDDEVVGGGEDTPESDAELMRYFRTITGCFDDNTSFSTVCADLFFDEDLDLFFTLTVLYCFLSECFDLMTTSCFRSSNGGYIFK